jgi:serine/threonine protein phosphatase PrpC
LFLPYAPSASSADDIGTNGIDMSMDIPITETAQIPIGIKPRDEEVDVFGITHQGLVRKRNEDQFLVATLHKRLKVHGTSLSDLERLPLESERLAAVVMVADGVGGAAAGDQASRMAVESAMNFLTHSIQCYYTANSTAEEMFLAALHEAVAGAQQAVLAAREKDPRLSGMATTLTVGIGIWPKAYLVHVGDSRAYLVRGGRLRRLTRDQTLAQGMVEAGVLTPEGAEASPLSHVLTSAVGSDQFSPAISSFTMRQGDRFLLCTDGLTKHVSDARIREQLLAQDSSEAVCRALLDEALADGGSDNITIVAACARRAK